MATEINSSGQTAASTRNAVSPSPIVNDEYGNQYTLTKAIGEGGQGAVYRVNQSAGKDLAIKVQKDPSGEGILQDKKAYARTTRMVRRIMAMPAIERIAMPVAMLESPHCGYVMRFMDQLEPISKYLSPHSKDFAEAFGEYFTENGGYAKRINMLASLAELLCRLHGHGIIYGDISPANIFVSSYEDESQAWLIDVDNLQYASQSSVSIGTPLYRAPEIFNGSCNTMASDCYSFALVAYECLTFSKPFNGTIIDEEQEEDDFGSCPEDRIEPGELPYVYEGNPKNKAAYGFSTRISQLMTTELQELFLQTFCEKGRREPASRPIMADWSRAFANAAASLVGCKAGHRHIGTSCPFCRANKVQNDTDYCYTLSTYRLAEVCAPRAYGAYEEDESIDSESKELLLRCQDKFLRFTSADGRKARIPVPYRLISSAHLKRQPDSILMDIFFSDGAITVKNAYDINLKVLRAAASGAKTLDGAVIRISYNGTFRFEFRITREKQ